MTEEKFIVNILFLCDDLLINILKYAGYRHRSQSAVLTCKKFYSLCCEIDKFKFPLKLNNEIIMNDDVYNSIINSERKFKEMILCTNQLNSLISFWRLKTICFYKSISVVDLTWDSCKMARSEVATLLNFFPNLTKLECVQWKLDNNYFDEPQTSINLPALKNLKIQRSDDEVKDLFINYLSNNKLEILSIDSDPYDLLVNHSATVKELDISSETLSFAELPVENLTHLTLMLRKYKRNNDSILYTTIVAQKSNLIYLDLLKCEGIFENDNESFITICDMMNLRKLKINVDGLNRNTFKDNFNKLENLNDLEIESLEHNFTNLVDIIEDFCNMKFINLRRLRIEVDFISIPLNRIEHMGRNFSNLKEFVLKCETPLALDLYLKNFKALESISIDYHYSRNFSNLCTCFDDEMEKYPTIKSIKLLGFSFGSDDMNWNELNLLRLIKMTPNIEAIDIDINLPLNMKLILNILSRLPKIKSIDNLFMSQTGENYEKFEPESILHLLDISSKLVNFSIELKLKSIDMDVSALKQTLKDSFKFNLRKYGNFVIITLKK